jgi:hypothetical protein
MTRTERAARIAEWQQRAADLRKAIARLEQVAA